MSKYKKLPVVGSAILEEEWPRTEQMAMIVEQCGMVGTKILKFIQGSTKFIASISPDEDNASVEHKLSTQGFKIVSPYTSKGQIVGYKVVYDPILEEEQE